VFLVDIVNVIKNQLKLKSSEFSELFFIYTNMKKYTNFIKENDSHDLKSDKEEIENKIIESLNDANDKLDSVEFSQLAESIIDYIDEISRSKNT